MKYVEIRIKSESRPYTYSIPPYIEEEGGLDVGDRVVVNCDPHNRGDGIFMIGCVEALTDYPRSVEAAKVKPVVDKVDVERWTVYREKESRLSEVLALMEARVREANAIALYRKLAETDAGMKALLDSYDSLAS